MVSDEGGVGLVAVGRCSARERTQLELGPAYRPEGTISFNQEL